jgi:hypothetical protein
VTRQQAPNAWARGASRRARDIDASTMIAMPSADDDEAPAR